MKIIRSNDIDNMKKVGAIEIGETISYCNKICLITGQDLHEPFTVHLFNLTDNVNMTLGYSTMVTPLISEIKVSYEEITE